VVVSRGFFSINLTLLQAPLELLSQDLDAVDTEACGSR
jgi:hypothetical protein